MLKYNLVSYAYQTLNIVKDFLLSLGYTESLK